jgi:hypothetical protein
VFTQKAHETELLSPDPARLFQIRNNQFLTRRLLTGLVAAIATVGEAVVGQIAANTSPVITPDIQTSSELFIKIKTSTYR